METARKHIGYRSRAQKVNTYGAKLNMDGQAWAGAFLETVIRESGERGLPSFTSTTAALREFTRSNLLFRVPRVGDIVFYAFSTDNPLGQPHVGLVTDVSRWKADGLFKAIEGQTESGLPRGPQEADGVYERIRYATDVLTFARPNYNGETGKTVHNSTAPFIRVPNVQPGKTGKSVVLLQQALADAVGASGMIKGKFDNATASAVAAYQRRIGYLNANGVPDVTTLSRLAYDTRGQYFRGTDLDNI